MNGPAGVVVLWFFCGLLAAALLRRLAGGKPMSEPLAPTLAKLPWAMWPFLGPARIICGWIGTRLPPGYSARVTRRLEKADLHPGVDGPQWASLCGSVAIAAAVCAWLMARLLGAGESLAPTMGAAVAWMACENWLQGRIRDCECRIVRDLPPYLDLFTVCVEAGSTLTAAARFIVEQAPDGPLRNYFDRVLREVRSGRNRAQAFVSVADAYGVECLCALASALAHAETSGMSIGQVLRTQAEQRSAERFVRAERQAMQAPVKMLGPLIFCIFPCTFIILAVPIAHRLMEAFGT